MQTLAALGLLARLLACQPSGPTATVQTKNGAVPVNHMVVLKESLAKSSPGIVREVYRLLLASKQAAGLPKPGAIDLIPFGFDAVRPSLELMSAYAFEMKLTPRRYSVEELFDDTTRALQA